MLPYLLKFAQESAAPEEAPRSGVYKKMTLVIYDSRKYHGNDKDDRKGSK